MIHFVWPFCILLLPLPWIIKYIYKPQSDNIITAIRFPCLSRLQSAFIEPKSIVIEKFNWQQMLIIMAWVCMVISLMRPEIVEDYGYLDNKGYDLLMAVDLSRSMDTIDFLENGKPVSRIAATKKVVGDFVRQREGDRVGLIVFADHAYMTVPLSLDTHSVGKMLDNLLVGMAGDSTAIGDAIGIGVQVLRKRPALSRVLILLTDGQDNASHIPPLTAAKIAKEENIKIYTVGVGNQIDNELLTEIASMTGGTFSVVRNLKDLTQVYNEIDRLEKSNAKQQAVLISKPIYYIFTNIALLCLLGVFVYRMRWINIAYGTK